MEQDSAVVAAARQDPRLGGYFEYFDSIAETLPITEPDEVVLKIFNIPAMHRMDVQKMFRYVRNYLVLADEVTRKQAEARGVPPGAWRPGVIDLGIKQYEEISNVVPAALFEQLVKKGFRLTDVYWFNKPRTVKSEGEEKKTVLYPVLSLTLSRRVEEAGFTLRSKELQCFMDVLGFSYEYAHAWNNEDGMFPVDPRWTGQARQIRVDTVNLAGKWSPAGRSSKRLLLAERDEPGWGVVRYYRAE